MSTLKDQIRSFQAGVKSASSSIPIKGAASKSNAPASSQSSAYGGEGATDLKRKRQDNDMVYSQPENTGTGQNTMTQITYAVEYLKSKGTPQTLADLLSYLSLTHKDQKYKHIIASILMRHDKVEYHRKLDGAEGTFSFRPAHNIKSADSLIGYLQFQSTAQGLSARELREGWPGAEAAIDDLEKQGKLLVTRNRKDNHAKMVWSNDPSLRIDIDAEFQSIWHNKIPLPAPEALVDDLKRAGLTPANKTGAKKNIVKAPDKKKKKPRKGGKTTNTHMIGVLRDYSHKRK